MKSNAYLRCAGSPTGTPIPVEHIHSFGDPEDPHGWWDQSISSCEHGLYPDFWLPETCGAGSPPCMDPNCEDYLPCEVFPHPCKPEECFGLVCTSEKCESEKSCCNTECLQSRCITPSCGQECLNIPCGSSCPDTVCLKDVCCQVDDHCHTPNCQSGSVLHTKQLASSGIATTNSSNPFEILRLACANVIESQPSTEKVQPFHPVHDCSLRMKHEGDRAISCSKILRGEKRGLLNASQSNVVLDFSQKRPKLVTRTSDFLKQEAQLENFSPQAPPKRARENIHMEPFTCLWAEPAMNERKSSRIICGKRFNNEQELQTHLETCHVDNMLHERNMLKRASVSQNPDLFTKQSPKLPDDDLYCHWINCPRAHTNGFAVKGKLHIHLRTHTGYKPFPCPLCPSRFKTPDALAKHTRTHTGERPYACPEPGCDRKFATPTELKTHATVHSGERPHACPICGQQFADSSNLSKHKKTHREKGHICMQCGARFTRSDHLERHCLKLGHCLDAHGRTVRGKSRASSISTVSEITVDGGGYLY